MKFKDEKQIQKMRDILGESTTVLEQLIEAGTPALDTNGLPDKAQVEQHLSDYRELQQTLADELQQAQVALAQLGAELEKQLSE